MNHLNACFASHRVNELSPLGREFKISRDLPSEEFLLSVEKDGVLDPPLLLEEKDNLRVIFGFNRIDAAEKKGAENITCLKFFSLSADEYAAAGTLRVYRGDTGPVGRLRMIEILRNFFSADNRSILGYARGRWGVPDEFIHSDDIRRAVLSFGKKLSGYLDSKDIGYKTIKILTQIPSGTAALLGGWAAASSMRVNIFKSSADMIYEIIKRDGPKDVDVLANSIPESAKEIEGFIFGSLIKLRYPEHSALTEKVEAIVKRIAANGISADFPLRTENDHLSITVKLGRKRDLPSALRSIEESGGDIEALLKLL